jgi:hypothetical protein
VILSIVIIDNVIVIQCYEVVEGILDKPFHISFEQFTRRTKYMNRINRFISRENSLYSVCRYLFINYIIIIIGFYTRLITNNNATAHRALTLTFIANKANYNVVMYNVVPCFISFVCVKRD